MADEQLKVTTAVDNTGFSSGLDGMKAQSKEFGESIKGEFGEAFETIGSGGAAAAGAFIVALDLLKDALGEDFEKAEKLANASERFGASTTSLQELTNAAQQHGATMEDVTSAYNKLELNSQAAIEGNKEMIDSFASLGVSVDDLKTKSLDEIMNMIADGTANATDKGQAYDSVVKTLGKSAGVLFDTLKLGSAQIKEVGDASGVMSENTVAALDRMGQESRSLWGRFSAWAGDAFVSAVDGLETLYIVYQSYIQGMTESLIAFGELLADIWKHGLNEADFTAFKDKFNDAIKDAADSAKQRLTELANPSKGEAESGSERAARAGEDKGEDAKVKAAQKTKEEIDKLNRETAEKEAKAKYDALSLDQKIAEQKQIIEQKSSPLNHWNDLEQAQANLAIATAKDTLVELEKQKAEADKRQQEKNKETAKKKEEEEVKKAESIAQKKLAVEQEQYKKLEEIKKRNEPHFDDLRKDGGGLAGVNYAQTAAQQGVNNQLDALKQQIELQKQELTLLRQIANPDSADDGSYVASS